ncbi:GH39 family glycosyl hydrolase [Evansella halocellulosilytica]|uniref:GH39 family glycosyl hydrolase n=1 Tax=Evansella halocellulosilytica TaxID=2011013 RepID=UPI000BB776C7|nr:xylan 1,4-beta-xylosidase [Evansella halocellulosilytica]
MDTIHINRSTQKSFHNHWKHCIGTGRLGLALQKEYLDHLKLVQEEIGFKYIRGHGLFHEDIGIYKEVDTVDGVKPFYNFTYIDRIFDSFLQLGLRPFVELGFMPKKLASDDQTIFYWEGNVTPPADYHKWHDLITNTIEHFIHRYGLEEVLQWPFEVWNEPNLVNFWKGADKEEYFKLYKVTAHAVKQVHRDLQVGGPAICGGSDEWITDFLNFCKTEHVPVDFVTRHAYTSKPPKKKTNEYYYQDLAENTDMLNQFETVRKLINESPYPDLPFHITEYNTSYSPINPIHDTNVNAAYLGKILSDAGDIVDSFSYWTFSDVFEEFDIPRAPFHGGFGLVALHSIRKPTFHLFAFFNQLGSKLLFKNDNMIVTEKDDGSIALVAWNLVSNKGDGFEKTHSLTIPFKADHVFMFRETADENHANPWKVWKELGRPRFPSQKQVKLLQTADQPLVRTNQLQTDNQEVSFNFTLTKNEVTYIELQSVHDETDSYEGLDDSLLTCY